MYTIIIIGIIGFIVAVIMAINFYNEIIDEYSNFTDYVFAFIMGLLQSAVGIVMGAVIGFVIALTLPAIVSTKSIKQPLATIQDGNSVNGSFFLGCGSIEGRIKYTYYIENNGLYEMKQLDYENVLIKYDSIPCIETIHEYINTDLSLMNKFAMDKINDRYIIHVPKGTINQDYRLDAQ